MSKRERTVLVIIYNEVVYYPPTINALFLLSTRFDKIIVLELVNENHKDDQYPMQVKQHRIIRNFSSFTAKLKTLNRFVTQYRKLRRQHVPDLILMYDQPAALIVYIDILLGGQGKVLWYHSHDVLERKQVGRFSMMKLALYAEHRILKHLDIFTLPSAERALRYNLNAVQGIHKILPNYPSLHFFQSLPLPAPSPSEIKILYQGNISAGHGIEELIAVMPFSINGKRIKLIIIGFIQPNYQAKLNSLITKHQAEQDVVILEKMTYHQLSTLTRSCHIGLAVYTKTDIMNATLGTASNKIYEYTAAGLPFLYYNSDHFLQYLKEMPWAFPIDLSADSIRHAIHQIDDQYESLSRLARQEFIEHRNYDQVFSPLMDLAVQQALQHELSGDI